MKKLAIWDLIFSFALLAYDAGAPNELLLSSVLKLLGFLVFTGGMTASAIYLLSYLFSIE